MVINPELTAAQEIARILRIRRRRGWSCSPRGARKLVSFRLPADSPVIGAPLSQLPQKLGARVLFCAVDRGGDVSIPDGAFELRAGDRVYLTGAAAEIAEAFRAQWAWSPRACAT